MMFASYLVSLGIRALLFLIVTTGTLPLIWLAWTLPGRTPLRMLLVALCVAGVAGIVGGPMFDLGLRVPTPLARLLGLCTAITVILILFQVIRAILLAPAALVSPLTRGPLRMLMSRRTSLMIALSGLLTGAFAFRNAARVPEVRDVDVPIPGLPDALVGFTIVQLTDMHLGTIFDAAWLDAVVEKANALSGDIIAITGDTGEAPPRRIAAALAPLARLRAKQGVYFSLGNHETYQGVDAWVSYYRQAGCLLRNEHVVIRHNGESLTLAGIDDSKPDPVAALAGSPGPRIMLGHRPAYAAAAAAAGADLLLAGHTHGGILPGIRSLVAMGNQGYVAGMYKVGKMSMYVSRGTGLWSYMPLRIAVPSEITRLRLVRAEKG